MRSFFSWISGLFSGNRPEPGEESRLLTPSRKASGNDAQDKGDILAKQLEEHLFCWLLDVGPSALQGDLASAHRVLESLNHRLHNKKRIHELPRRPHTLPMLMTALSDESTDRKRLGEIILGDPALTEQLLKMANSPYFRTRDSDIDSVDQAIFVLGMDGIRNVIAAAVARPVLAARNSREAVFAQRVWTWGLTCARGSELIARIHGHDASAHFIAGLLPSLGYITVRRELERIYRAHFNNREPEPAVIRHALARNQWVVCQRLAEEWGLPPKYHALLLSAERPLPGHLHTPLSDGMILGTREVLRHSRQRNLAEEDLQHLIQLTPEQITGVRKTLRSFLREERESAGNA